MDNDTIIKAYYSFKTTPEGQIVLKDLRDTYFEKTFLHKGVTQEDILLAAGAREVIIYILRKIEDFELQQGVMDNGR